MPGRWLCWLLAAVIAVPVGALVYLDLLLLVVMGLNWQAPDVLGYLLLLGAVVAATWWSGRGRRPAEVAWRGAGLGVVAALVLPLAGLVGSVVQLSQPDIGEAGMGALFFYGLPIMCAGVGAVAALLFGLLRALTARRLRNH